MDWLRRELDDVSPELWNLLTGWAQLEKLQRRSPTLLEIALTVGGTGGAAGLVRYGPRYVVSALQTLVDGWHDYREEREQHKERIKTITARGDAVRARERARAEAARLAATACREARHALRDDRVDQEARNFAERLAAPVLAELVNNEAIDDVTLKRRQRAD